MLVEQIKDMENAETNCEMIWKIQKKGKSNSEKIWTLWKNPKSNSETKLKMRKKIVK